MIVSCVATIITMYTLKSAPHQQQMLAGLLFATGALLSLGYSSFCIYPSGLTDRNLFPLATALVNTLGQLGGACTPIITGVLLDHYSWSAVFTTMSIAAAAGFVLLLTIIEPVTTKVD
jgi:sugar phosphate permease